MVLVLVDRLQLRRSQFRDDIGHRVDLFRVVPLQLLVELVRVHRNRQDVRIHHETQRLRGLVIQRRTHRQIQLAVLVTDRDHTVTARGVVLHHLDHRLLDIRGVLWSPHIGPQVVGHHLEHLLLREQTVILDHLHQRLAGALDFLDHIVELLAQLRMDARTFVDQKVDQG